MWAGKASWETGPQASLQPGSFLHHNGNSSAVGSAGTNKGIQDIDVMGRLVGKEGGTTKDWLGLRY